MFTHTHLIVDGRVGAVYRIAGNRPFIDLADGDDRHHTITLTLKDAEAVDGLIAALTKGRGELAPARKEEAA